MTKEEDMTTNRISIKRHPVSVYLPPNGMADRWKRLAEKAGLSLSQYVRNTVEDHIRNEEPIDPNDLGRPDRIKERTNLQEKRLSDMEKKIRAKKQWDELAAESLIKSLDEEGGVFKCFVKNGINLVNLLKEKGVVREDELMDLLHIDHDDTESVKSINQHLDNLIDYDHIKRINGEIIWVK